MTFGNSENLFWEKQLNLRENFTCSGRQYFIKWLWSCWKPL